MTGPAAAPAPPAEPDSSHTEMLAYGHRYRLTVTRFAGGHGAAWEQVQVHLDGQLITHYVRIINA